MGLNVRWKGAGVAVLVFGVLAAATAAVTALSEPRPSLPLAGLRIVVDPGHGGSDRGACHFGDGLIEKQINLDMAFRLEERLRDLGAEIFLTRLDDRYVSLDERAALANRLGAHMLISLHVNRYPSAVCFGAQTFYYPGSVEGHRLAVLIQDELLRVDPDNYRRALPGHYKVLRLSAMPGALVEIGFITHPGDRRKLTDFGYRDRVADAIARGIVRFASGESPGTDPSEPGIGRPAGNDRERNL